MGGIRSSTFSNPDDSSVIVAAHGQDIDGEPFAGERVCFYVDDKADSYRLFSGTTGPAGARFNVSTAQATTPSTIHPDVRCAYLDANGNAALEVFNSGDQTINVIAEYIDEGLLHLLGATKNATGAAKKARLTTSRLVRVGTKRYLQVKVKSSASRAKLAIRLRLANGKVVKVTRSVRTNRTVRVMRVSSAVKSVKVSLIR